MRIYTSTFILASIGFIYTNPACKGVALKPLDTCSLADTLLLYPRLPVGLQSPSPEILDYDTILYPSDS